MATRYFCDGCEKEIVPPTKSMAELGTRPIANLQFIDPSTGKQTTKMLCADCTKTISESFDNLKNKIKLK